MIDVKKLISLVREKLFLYDTRHINYRNRVKCAEAWIEIAVKMGGKKNDGKKWAGRWKNLRDNYKKYKRSCAHGSIYYKYKHWPWAEHMKFIDEFIEKPTTIAGEADAASRTVDEADSEVDSEDNNPLMGEVLDPSSPESDRPVPADHLNTSSPVGPQRCTNNKRRLQKRPNTQPVLKKIRMDGIDHLFHGYAMTLKGMPPRIQCMLKLDIATLFAKYELQVEMGENGSDPATEQEDECADDDIIHVKEEDALESCTLHIKEEMEESANDNY